ncbi:MAG: hypothetical protein IPO09_07195 [Anaeromyxobacter sp.]|nr:hypothetical protein [Anaeromyxobacter sp.]MBL0277962.1 hypothetical protein [Anaeromyxobacter sp.]
MTTLAPGRQAGPAGGPRARSRRALAALVGLLGPWLGGCPLPQSLPEYPSTGRIAPPRIVTDQATPPGTVVEVAPDCPGADTDHVFSLSAGLIDENTVEPVEARWFVDYQPGRSTVTPIPPIEIIPGPEDGVTLERPLTPFQFRPYTFDDAAFRAGGGLHVVELVVSNGFLLEPTSGLPRPWRTPQAQYETQVHRWVFHYVPAGAGGACGYPAP